MGIVERENRKLFDGPLNDGLPSIVAAAHELKSPLALMRQLSLMLESETLSKDEQKRMLRQITLTSERAIRLTSDLTKSTRLSGAMFELEPINPHQVCRDIVHELTPLFKANGREIKLASRKSQLLLVANRDLLRRIIINFSDNALNYSDNKSSVEIKIELCDSGRTVRLGVRDHGPALPISLLNMLKSNSFTPTQIQARPQSSGLGLYIVNQFANIMNGKVGVKKHRDGSTFYVDLQASRQLSLL